MSKGCVHDSSSLGFGCISDATAPCSRIKFEAPPRRIHGFRFSIPSMNQEISFNHSPCASDMDCIQQQTKTMSSNARPDHTQPQHWVSKIDLHVLEIIGTLRQNPTYRTSPHSFSPWAAFSETLRFSRDSALKR